MALVTCKECGETVSSKAVSCPKCGAPVAKPVSHRAVVKRQSMGLGTGCLVVVAVFWIGIKITDIFEGAPTPSKNSKSRIKPAKPTKKMRIERQFSSWDGSHRKLTKLIKQAMNDPGSFDHVKTLYRDNGDHLVVSTSYRGKNAFGGIVKNWIRAKVDLDGNVLKIIEQGP